MLASLSCRRAARRRGTGRRRLAACLLVVHGASATAAGLALPPLTVAGMGTPLQWVATGAAGVGWTVADPAIATVDAAGRVLPLRAGFTAVTASAGGSPATGVPTVRGPTPIPTRSRYVGTNVGGIAYYASNFPFSDLMKTSGGWGSSDKAPFASTGADGTPTALKPGQTASTPVAWDHSHYPAGRYTVLWDGTGAVGFPNSRVRIVESRPHRIVLEPTDTEHPMWVGIDATDPADPVRNVRFLLPGTEASHATQPFNPTYLQRIAPFSQLRFMDWGATNGSPVVEWADRALPSQATYTGDRGVPIERMIDLANTLHVDPWFCVPHQASDDYVRRFATLLHARLDPTLRPHIEYSNEVWNGGFAQTRWAVAQSEAQKLARPFGMPSVFYARRAVQVFRIMRAVWGPEDAKRLVRVLAGQAAWTQFLESALGAIDPAADVDAIAIAPYFDAESAGKPANADATLRLGPDQVIEQMLQSVRGPVKSWMTANAALAARHRLKLLAYESGPGDTSSSFPDPLQDRVLALFRSAHASPRMQDVYLEYWGQWKAVGGATMNQYVDVAGWSKWGLWGALEYTFQDPATSPKYRGLLSFIAANPQAPDRGR